MHEHAHTDPLPNIEQGVEGGQLLQRGADPQQLPLEALRVFLHVQVLESGRVEERDCMYMFLNER